VIFWHGWLQALRFRLGQSYYTVYYYKGTVVVLVTFFLLLLLLFYYYFIIIYYISRFSLFCLTETDTAPEPGH
jgi:hypothetical protein